MVEGAWLDQRENGRNSWDGYEKFENKYGRCLVCS